MQAAIQNKQGQLEALRQEVITAPEVFRSKSRFFVTQSGNGWTVVSSSNNRVYGRNTSYPQAVRYAESLEHAVNAKSAPVLKASPPDDIRTRWAALWALVLIVLAGALSS